ncbi:VgrG-related protein [Chroococcidiopsis sp.]|uniref:VgrG-related protein n=1 Tax=Chroococcidiopsis sp. TaxID=3088168 RepID=UPI003F3A146E
MPLEKAKLIVHSSPFNPQAKDIEFMFNPTEISFTRTANWEDEPGNRGSSLLPKVNFSGVAPYQLTLSNLLFDTYETKTSVMQKYIDNIKQGVSAKATAPSRPPVYIFVWKNKYFHCVIESLTYKLTMFLADGTPVRALVDMTLREVDPENLPGGKATPSNSPKIPNPQHPAGGTATSSSTQSTAPKQSAGRVTMSANSQNLYLSELILKLGGAIAPPELMKDVLEICVEESLHLPAMFTLVIHNTYLSASDRSEAWRHDRYFKIGDRISIGFAASTTEDRAFKEALKEPSLIEGEITAMEVNFTDESKAHIVVRGYDVSHRLHRGRYNRSFTNTTDSDIVRKLAKESGIQIGQVDRSGTPHEYVFQENQTNMEFLRERAARIGFELFVQDNKLYFRQPKNNESLQLKWLDEINSFSVRATSAQQVSSVEVRSWDYSKKQLINETAKAEQVVTTTGNKKGSSTSTAFKGGKPPKMVVVDQPVANAREAKKIAQALCNELGGEFICADARADGNPKIRPGKVVQLKGMGDRYSGKYYVTETRHLYSQNLYSTEFSVRGLHEGTLLSTLAPQTHLQPGQTLMVGIVTDNKDPKEWGRVKVKLPTLNEKDESNWARVVGLGAAKNRGFYCLPEINDEVLVGFEHGDIHRPYIIGGVWNGVDKTVEKVNETVDRRGRVRLRTIKTRTGHTIQFVEEDSLRTKAGIYITTSGGHNVHLNDSRMKKSVMIQTSGGHQITMEDRSVPPTVSISSKGNLSLSARGELSLEAGTKMSLSAPTMLLNAQAQMFLSANTTMLLRSPVVIGLAAPRILLGGAPVPPPASITQLAPLIAASQVANIKLP